MKKVILLFGILLSIAAAQVAVAQVSEGIITYEVKVNMHRNLPADRAEMKNMIPEFRTSKEQLLFNNSESLYKPVEEEEEDETFNDGNGAQMRFRTPQNKVYVNQATSRRVLLQEFMGKKYLMDDSLRVSPWKFDAETRVVAGHTCRQASFYNEERKQKITAWYTDKLRPFLGPENFNTLPGAVLQVDINDGERTVTAVKIEPRTLTKKELRAPTSGSRITEPEFRKMVADHIERVRANGGNVIIRN